MILQGSIERFNLASVLQFLAQNAATGVLEVRDFEEYGFIYLVKGRLEGISLPVTDEKLGVHLLRSGALSEEQLARVLMEASEEADGGERKALGQRLVERGFVSEETVREAMRRLTVSRVFELAHWRSGTFSYHEPERMPHFQISIQGDVQELLLLTQQRIDEGQRPRKHAPQETGDLCHDCPVSDCTPQIKSRHLKRDVCLWRKMSAVMDEQAGRPGPESPVPAVTGGGGPGDGPGAARDLLEAFVTDSREVVPVSPDVDRPY